jgi:hypothetical protein
VPRVETFSQTFRIGRTVKPTSSIASRATAASWLSPGSTSPLTGAQCPPPRMFGAL